MERNIITIDQEKCTGCGLCIPNCPEGAIQIIDGKARLVSDLFCDGLGACLGHCPEGAISIEKREAEAYDEGEVMANIVQQGPATIKAHLQHLREHNETEYLKQALDYLKKEGIEIPQELQSDAPAAHAGCPGSRTRTLDRDAPAANAAPSPSQLGHWPVQMHLVSPGAPQYRNADVLLAADCVAYALGDFHARWLSGKALAIACPKLDAGLDVYMEKIKALIDEAQINTLTVMIMQVPCCGGLLRLAQKAASETNRKVPVKAVVVSIEGEILKEEWV
jgi:ferredoxin